MRRLPVLPTIFLLPVLTLLSTALAQGGSEVQALNCAVRDQLPRSPAAADQGGYLFEYQALVGEAPDGRACTVYRLRNTPGKPPTPVRWAFGDEVLIGGAHLPRCPAEIATCDWLSVARYFSGGVATDDSLLSYGLNADAFRRQVETYRVGAESDPTLTAQSVGTEVEGVFGDADGREIVLHAVVKSRIEPSGDGLLAVLEIEDLSGSGLLLGGSLQIAWEAFDLLPAAAALAEERGFGPLLGVVTDGTATIPEGARLERSERLLRVMVPVEGYRLVRTTRLTIRPVGAVAPLVALEMPAFAPSGDP